MREDLKDARILIVDDEPASVQMLRKFLDTSGFVDVRATADSSDVASIVSSFDPDLILLDLRMPGRDGFDVMRDLESHINRFYLPILVLSGDITTEAKRQSLASGARDFLNKPFDLTEVLLRIQNLLETRFLHLALRRQNELLEERVSERTAELERVRLEIHERLSLASDYRDDATGAHTKRVGEMAARIGAQLDLPAGELEHLHLAACLHDIGKIGIPDMILLKPAALTPEERALMRTHTTIGARVLSGSRSPMLRMAEIIALCHHERWDGRGYPRGLAGDAIPLPARIVALADVVDALSSERPYRGPWSHPRILAWVRDQSGKHFDPQVVTAYLRVLRRFPPAETRVPAAAMRTRLSDLDSDADPREPGPLPTAASWATSEELSPIVSGGAPTARVSGAGPCAQADSRTEGDRGQGSDAR